MKSTLFSFLVVSSPFILPVLASPAAAAAAQITAFVPRAIFPRQEQPSSCFTRTSSVYPDTCPRGVPETCGPVPCYFEFFDQLPCPDPACPTTPTATVERVCETTCVTDRCLDGGTSVGTSAGCETATTTTTTTPPAAVRR